jgi:hypothetical protein
LAEVDVVDAHEPGQCLRPEPSTNCWDETWAALDPFSLDGSPPVLGSVTLSRQFRERGDSRLRVVDRWSLQPDRVFSRVQVVAHDYDAIENQAGLSEQYLRNELIDGVLIAAGRPLWWAFAQVFAPTIASL